jgi:hypothetical protein
MPVRKSVTRKWRPCVRRFVEQGDAMVLVVEMMASARSTEFAWRSLIAAFFLDA